jgi:magnesium transporter
LGGDAMPQDKNKNHFIKNIEEIIEQKTETGIQLWEELIQLHPADLVDVLDQLNQNDCKRIFIKFPCGLQVALFSEFSVSNKSLILSLVDHEQQSCILRKSPIDELVDFFEAISDTDLKKYLEVLNKQDRQKAVSLLQFDPESAGGIMNTDIVTLMHDLTVARSVTLLQRVRPNKQLHQQIYVTDRHNILQGYIQLEDLVLQSPETALQSILKQPYFIAIAHQDQEAVAHQMVHYSMQSAPVVNKEHLLLGVIYEDDIIHVIQSEATENIHRMSAVVVEKRSYFDIPFKTLIYSRGSILAILLIAESLTSVIIGTFENTLTPFLVAFFTTLVSTGGNTSCQTSAITIQGMSSGDINDANVGKFVRREMLIGVAIALILAAVVFLRAYLVKGYLLGSFVVSLSLGSVVVLSVFLGSCIPILLKKLGLDPAFSAGPFLATMIDIFGIFIYCYIAYLFLS